MICLTCGSYINIEVSTILYNYNKNIYYKIMDPCCIDTARGLSVSKLLFVIACMANPFVLAGYGLLWLWRVFKHC